MLKKSISIVIPTYNGKHLLEQNLPSVYDAIGFVNIDFEIIIVDDASIDNTKSFLQSNYPNVKLIVNKKNLGFSPTINKGIFCASKDLVFLLNNDVKLTKEYFLPKFKYFEKEDTFGVMGKIVGYDNDVIQDEGKFPNCTFLNIDGTTNYRILNSSTELWMPTFMLSGANALVDREKLLKIKGFNEIFAPFYGEDTDLSLRALKCGWKLFYEPLSVCRHPNSVTIAKYNKASRVKDIAARNKILFHWIHLGNVNLKFYFIKITLKFIAFALLNKMNFVRGFIMAIKMRKEAFCCRKELKTIAKNGLTIRQIVTSFHEKLKMYRIEKY